MAKRGHGFDTEKYVGKKTRYKIFKTTRSAFQPPNKSLYVPLEASTAISKTNLNNGENDSADFARLFLSSVLGEGGTLGILTEMSVHKGHRADSYENGVERERGMKSKNHLRIKMIYKSC